jgi:hypothetical protein
MAMTIYVKRVPSTEKEKPCFKIYEGSSLTHTEVIDGRADVNPAYLRVVAFCKKRWNLELYPAKDRRDQNKRLTWVSDVSKSKDAPKVTKQAGQSETKQSVLPMAKEQIAEKLQQNRVLPIAARSSATTPDPKNAA